MNLVLHFLHMPLLTPHDSGLGFDAEPLHECQCLSRWLNYKPELTRVPLGVPEPQVHCCSDSPALGVEIHPCVTWEGGDMAPLPVTLS